MGRKRGPNYRPRKPINRGRNQGKNGRPRIERTEKVATIVETLSAIGYSQEYIAGHLTRMGHSMSVDTLVDRYALELQNAEANMMNLAYNALARGLKKGEPWAVSLVMRTRGKNKGWTERVEHSGPDGGSIPHRISSLTDAQIAQLIDRLEKGDSAGSTEGGEGASATD